MSTKRLNTQFNSHPASLRSFLNETTEFIPPESPPETTVLNSLELELTKRLSLCNQHFEAFSDTKRPAINHDDLSYRKIGAGSCGAIFAQEGQPFVVKVAKSNSNSLWSDYTMHACIADQFRIWNVAEIKIPACYYFVPRGNSYFHYNPALQQAAEKECNMPKSALVTERIFPLPLRTRNILIDIFCGEQAKDVARHEPANRDCLVRVYLGSMWGVIGRHFSLRNFKLHLNQMAHLQMDAKVMAGRIAIALAVMHWAAKTDARDVEFVLGGSSQKISAPIFGRDVQPADEPIYTGPASKAHDDFFARTTDLWVLDFNQVQPITMDEEGVATAVEAYKLNDPYFPRPLRESRIEKVVWNEFVEQYLGAAHSIIREEENTNLLPLPGKFINGLIALERYKQQRD
ncbi:zinc finger domain-containing protein [Trichoderma sp. SZMC 28014]